MAKRTTTAKKGKTAATKAGGKVAKKATKKATKKVSQKAGKPAGAAVKKSSRATKSVANAGVTQDAEAQVVEMIEKFSPASSGLVAALRKVVRTRLPGACEIAYAYRSWFVLSYSPSEHGYEGVLAIRGDAEGVKFYFSRGKELADPEKLLKGSAGVLYIEVDNAETLARPAVVKLMEEAIKRSAAKFGGVGRVVVKTGITK